MADGPRTSLSRSAGSLARAVSASTTAGRVSRVVVGWVTIGAVGWWFPYQIAPTRITDWLDPFNIIVIALLTLLGPTIATLEFLHRKGWC